MLKLNSLLVIHRYLHERVLSRDAVYADRNTETGQRDACPTKVTNGGIRSNPIALGIIEERVRLQATVALRHCAARVQADLVSLIQTKCRVVRLDARAPNLAV